MTQKEKNAIKKIVFIFGPTASGKTALAEQLAAQIPAEIINMDSAQFYRPLTIGTAKSDWQQSPTQHHLFDILDKPEHLTVHAYRQLVLEKIDNIWSRKHVPILVGGSGFYLKSLLFPPADTATKKDKGLFDTRTTEQLWRELQSIDPKRAAEIHPNDRYRLERALAIWYATGKKPSLYKPEFNPPAPFLLVYLNPDRQELYKRINTRVLQMIDAGLIQEVSNLRNTDWQTFLQEKGIIGYPEVLDYLDGRYTLKETITLIQKRTRNFARKQEIFWRMLKKEIQQAQQKEHWGTIMEFDLTLSDHDLYIKQLLDEISKLKTGAYG